MLEQGKRDRNIFFTGVGKKAKNPEKMPKMPLIVHENREKQFILGKLEWKY